MILSGFESSTFVPRHQRDGVCPGQHVRRRSAEPTAAAEAAPAAAPRPALRLSCRSAPRTDSSAGSLRSALVAARPAPLVRRDHLAPPPPPPPRPPRPPPAAAESAAAVIGSPRMSQHAVWIPACDFALGIVTAAHRLAGRVAHAQREVGHRRLEEILNDRLVRRIFAEEVLMAPELVVAVVLGLPLERRRHGEELRVRAACAAAYS